MLPHVIGGTAPHPPNPESLTTFMKTKIRPTLIFLGATALLFSTASLRADDVTDSIDEAVKAYKDGDYAMAASSLDGAAQLIRQKRAESFTKHFPAAPSGWTAEDATSEAVGAAMFGGGITAERRYAKGESEVTMKLVTDSPMMSAMMMMMNNPMMLGSGDSGKLERIKGQKALVKYDGGDKSGEINIAVAGTLLITITGNNVTAAELKSFAEAIDYSKLAAAL
jgi:hypothetical protein